MQATWLLHQGHQRLLLFFNGWGMDKTPFSRLTSQHYDVLMLYHYSDLTWPEEAAHARRNYPEYGVIAWSMGVWAAALNPMGAQPLFTLAINGTLQPIDLHYGIAPAIFQLTLKQWSPATRERFYQNMFFPAKAVRSFYPLQPRRSCSDQQTELEQLEKMILSQPPPSGLFTSALISRQDKIIPAQRQLAYWKNKIPYTLMEQGHFPFFLWPSWEELIAYAHPR